MDRFRTLGLLAAALLGLACNERLLDVEPTEPLCMIAAGTMGTRADGTSSILLYPVREGTPFVCSCITEEQYWDEAQFAEAREELNDLLLEECEWVADALGYVSNECQVDHDNGRWLSVWVFAVGRWEYPFECAGAGWIDLPDPAPPICELGEPGCSCTVEAACSGGTTCIDGMCQAPP